MSRRKTPDPLGSNTRQMLDELDVLMEKMLALPVNQLDDGGETQSAPAAVAPPPARDRHEPKPQPASRTTASADTGGAQFLVGQLAILHSPATHDALPTPKSTNRDDRAAAVPVATVPLRQDAAVGGYESNDASGEYLPPLSSLAPAVGDTSLPEARRFSLRFRPLLWLNQGFDLLTQRLGLPGSWLRHSGGRAVLGILGLLFLAAALTWWLKETLGWTWLWESVE